VQYRSRIYVLVVRLTSCRRSEYGTNLEKRVRALHSLESGVKGFADSVRRKQAEENVHEIIQDLENVNINAIVLKATRIVDIIKKCKAEISDVDRDSAEMMSSLIKKWLV
jgi:hypothetical protein